MTGPRPHSEANPQMMAFYLHDLIKAAVRLLESGTGPSSAGPGFHALMTVIEERADQLSSELDAPAFGDLWPQLDAWLDRDPTMGLAG